MFFGSSKTKSRNLLRQEQREKRQQRGLSLEKSNFMTNGDRVGPMEFGPQGWGWTTKIGRVLGSESEHRNDSTENIETRAPKYSPREPKTRLLKLRKRQKDYVHSF